MRDISRCKNSAVWPSPVAPCRLRIGHVGLFSCFVLEDADSTYEIYWTLRGIYAIDIGYGGFTSQTRQSALTLL